MLKTIAKHIFLVGAILMLACMILMSTQIAHPAEKPSSDFYHKNITESVDQNEINPTFIDNDRVLYLVFTGDVFAPQPWDYKLAQSDIDGQSTVFLTSSGIIDYKFSENRQKVLMLRSDGRKFGSVPDCERESEVKDWQFSELDLQTGEEKQIAVTQGSSISEGYKLLGMETPLDFSAQYLTKSAQGLNRISVARRFAGDHGFITFQFVENDGSKRTVFKSEAWKPYAHLGWLPTITWLDETSFITLGFQSTFDKKLPQSEGSFSIVKVGAKDGIEVLYKDPQIHPFPKMVLAPNGIELFFRKLENRNTTQLWRLNIITRKTDLIYSVNGDLGEPRFSINGSSILLTQLSNDNFDVVRLDLEWDNIERIALN